MRLFVPAHGHVKFSLFIYPVEAVETGPVQVNGTRRSFRIIQSIQSVYPPVKVTDRIVIIPAMPLFMHRKDFYQFVRVIPDHYIDLDQLLVVVKEIDGAGQSSCHPEVKKNGAAP